MRVVRSQRLFMNHMTLMFYPIFQTFEIHDNVLGKSEQKGCFEELFILLLL